MKNTIYILFILLVSPFGYSKTTDPVVVYRDALCVSSMPFKYDFSKYCTQFNSRKTLVDIPDCIQVKNYFSYPSPKAYLCEKLTCKLGFILLNPEGINDGFYCDDSFYKK